MIGFLLLACATRAPPVLFPEAPPEMVPPEAPTWQTAPDECALGQPFLPSQPPPYIVLEKGQPIATCRAQLIPETRLADLLTAESDMMYWSEMAQICAEGRARDRLYAQQQHDETWRLAYESARDLRAQRWSTGAALVLGFVVGAGTTYAVTVVAVEAVDGG